MKNDTIWMGLLLGLVGPLIGYYLIIGILSIVDVLLDSKDIFILFQPRTHYLLAIAFNLLTVNWANKQYRTRTVRGIVTATLLYAFLWLWMFYKLML